MHLVALVPAMNWRQCYNVKDNCYWYLLLLLLLFVIGEGMESTLNGSGGFVDVRFTFPNLSGMDLFVSLSLISVHITLHYSSWYPITTIHYVNKPLISCSPLRLINSQKYPCFFFSSSLKMQMKSLPLLRWVSNWEWKKPGNTRKQQFMMECEMKCKDIE